MPKLKTLCEIEGFEDPIDMIRDAEFGMRPGSPGIRMNPGCDYTTDVEPDSDSGYCEICNTQTVRSAHMLMGII